MGLMDLVLIPGFALFPLLNLALEQKYGKKKRNRLLPTDGSQKKQG